MEKNDLHIDTKLILITNEDRKAGAELGQALLQLELGFTLMKVSCITLMITNYHYIS